MKDLPSKQEMVGSILGICFFYIKSNEALESITSFDIKVSGKLSILGA